jgi:tRNA U34 5-carboxymethylaminomethyl modifying GTPase MnmE/TrmE
MTRDTIFALSSGQPPAAIAVIRISGPRAADALQALTGRVPEPRRAALARVRDPETREVLDEALALFFPGPNSETGEDTAELQLHGGRAVVAGVLEALGRLEGFRPAEAGEFTRRAFANGRLDLTQVEGLADLIYADTAAQRRQAYRHLKGLLGERAETWRSRLIEALAMVEAGIDFSDEDVPGDLIRPALKITRELHDEISAALAGAGRGERLREGLVVAIAGPPNAGKSTLLNRIARREVAIVSPYAGTTRDVIEVHLDLEGYPVTLLDTAGIRDSDDPVEQEGVRRARARAAEADLVLWVVDAAEATDADRAKLRGGVSPTAVAAEMMHTASPPADAASQRTHVGSQPPHAGSRPALTGPRPGNCASQPALAVSRSENTGSRPAPTRSPPSQAAPQPEDAGLRPEDAGLRPEDARFRPAHIAPVHSDSRTSQAGSRPAPLHPPGSFRELCEDVPSSGPETWLIYNKIDRPHGHPILNAKPSIGEREFMFMSMEVSALEGCGMEELVSNLGSHAGDYFGLAEPALITRARHRSTLSETKAALARAGEPNISQREDLIAEELRLAARGLGRLTGRVDVEDVLDVIFRDFCIGK